MNGKDIVSFLVNKTKAKGKHPKCKGYRDYWVISIVSIKLKSIVTNVNTVVTVEGKTLLQNVIKDEEYRL